MKKQLTKRLEELKTEFTAGQKMLADLEEKETELKQNMLRISGAIQVLEEEISKTENPEDNAEVLDIKSSNE